MHTAHNGPVCEHGLEVNGEVVFSHQNGTKKEEQVSRSRPDNTLLDHRIWHHGVVTLVVFPDEEEDKGDGGADEKAYNNRAIPWVHGAAILQSKQKHDGRGADEHKARKIQRLDGGAEDLPRGQLDRRLGDLDEKQQNGQSGANGNVDVKACSEYQQDDASSGACPRRRPNHLHQRHVTFWVNEPPMMGPKAIPSWPMAKLTPRN